MVLSMKFYTAAYLQSIIFGMLQLWKRFLIWTSVHWQGCCCGTVHELYCYPISWNLLHNPITACAADSYAQHGDTECTPCPSNSTSQSGSEMCPCVSGYFRTSGQSVSLPCTSEWWLYFLLVQKHIQFSSTLCNHKQQCIFIICLSLQK